MKKFAHASSVTLLNPDPLDHLIPLVLVNPARSTCSTKTYVVPLERMWDILNNIEILQEIGALSKCMWFIQNIHYICALKRMRDKLILRHRQKYINLENVRGTPKM